LDDAPCRGGSRDVSIDAWDTTVEGPWAIAVRKSTASRRKASMFALVGRGYP
jgi:hypothetical protein